MPEELVTIFAGSAPAALALSSIVPADETADVAIDANIVLTFNNKISREAIVVATDAGVIIPGARTWDSDGKVLTFNPSAALTNNTTYIVTIGGVVDIYGQALVAEVKNFTTAVA
jgi:hypothetical protein